MAGFKLAQFKGIRPRRSALKLPDGESQTSINTKLGSGDLEPWVDAGEGFPVTNTFYNKTIHLFEADTINPKWLEWDTYVSVARGTVKGDATNRTYYTGDGAPKMTYSPIATSGGAPYPSQFRFLGIPPPAVAPTVVGTPLPETVDPSLRRTLPGSMTTKLFEAVFVNYSIYPGTGTPDEIWNLNAAATGDITFDLQPGFSAKVLEVVDTDTVTLGSATGSGAFAVTAGNDTTDITYWQPMDENGSTREADFVGWRIPDGLKVTIIGHLLRVGDVIRVTRSDYSAGVLFPFTVATNFYEQNWTAAVSVTVGGATFFQTPNGRIAASVDATADFPALAGGFYYDVDRTASTSSTQEDRTYVYTYVSALGEEGPPSPVSASIAALDGDTISITGMELPPTTGYDITEIRLYRTNATAAGTEFQFVKSFAVSTNTTEGVLAANLGEVIATTTWDGPDSEMQGITSMPNGMMVGFKGKNVYFCEPYFPHAWPPEYDQAVDYEIVALSRFGNSVAVLTEGVPSIITGSHPRNANIRPYEINQACSSALSVAASLDRVIYASPDGLIELGVNGVVNVTEQYARKEEWATFDPTLVVGEFHDGKYFGFYGAVGAVAQPPASLFLTGTCSGATEYDLNTPETPCTIILTLVSDTWLSVGANFDGSRQSIIDGIVSTSSFVTGWNATELPNILVANVVRTSDTVVTITLISQPAYSIVESETMFVTIPGTALTGGVGLSADVPFTIVPLEDYSSELMFTTSFEVGGTELPSSVHSRANITDWDQYVGMATTANEQVTFPGLAYSATQDRWLAAGYRDNGATTLPDTAVIVTSDDSGVTWTKRFHQLMTETDKYPRNALRYDAYDAYVVCGDNRSMQISADGETWALAAIDGTIPATESLLGLVIADSGLTPHMYAACKTADYLIRSPDLSLYPATNTWLPVPVTYVSATGTKAMGTGSGKVLSVGNYDTDMEISETLHGALTSAYVGAIASFDCVDLVMGDDLWVAVSSTFEITTCASGDEGTIGNWAVPSLKFGGLYSVGPNALTYDKGDGVLPGYGYVLAATTIATGLPVVFTSTDASLWLQKQTGLALAGDSSLAIAAKYPEDQLADPRLNFAPTYNGGQAPGTQIGNTTSSYDFLGLKGASTAHAGTSCVVYQTPADTIIKIYGAESGTVNRVTFLIEPLTTIFTLNVPCDEVRISLVSLDTGASDPSFLGTTPQVSAFTDGAFFAPVPYFDIGYEAHAYARAFAINGMGGAGIEIMTSEAIATFAFTFRKAGYNDLTVSYKVRGYSVAEATTTAP